MAFSLSSWFKGKPGSETDEAPTEQSGQQTPRVPPAAPAAPPPAVRTVLPSSAPSQNPVSLRPPGAPPLPKAPAPTTRNLSVRPPARKVSFPIPPSAAAPAPAPAPIPAPAPTPAPMAVPDVAVRLSVGDFLDRIPPGYLQAGDFDRDQVVEFRASELYSDLSKGRASVPASTIYAKCPQVFARPVTETEDFEVQLPLQKLVEQLSAAFTTRVDQVAEENVGEIETPFLKVAMEDNARLPTASGTVAGALRPAIAPPTEATASSGIPQRPAHRTGQISTISAKPAVEPPPAPAFAPPSAPINPGKRPPSTVRASVAGGKIRLSGPAAPARMASVPGPAVPPPVETKPPGTTQRIQVPSIQPVNPSVAGSSPSHQVTKKTARIQIPPISLKGAGTGSNTPRPPGAIPPPPAVPVQASPVTIRPGGMDNPVSFRSSPPPPPPAVKVPPPSFAPSRPSFPPPSFPAMPPAGGGTPSPVAPAPEPVSSPFASTDGRQISLGLAAVLRGQPASALAVEPSDVPDGVPINLPFGPIERQLSTGRVAVPRAAFLNALPEAHKDVLAGDSDFADVQIPLQEVFQNLPGNALAMRQDQVIEEIGDAYPTPFSQKAEEDAQRLGTVAPVAPPTVEVKAEAPALAEPDAPSEAAKEETISEEQAFGSVFEEQPSAPAEESANRVDQPRAEDESPASETPVFEETASRDLPLSSDAPADEEATTGISDRMAGEPTPDAAEVTGIHPAEPVEPPAAIEPPPVAEALAVLESSAPGHDQAEEPAVAVCPEPPVLEAPALAVPAAAPAAALRPASVPQDSALQTLFMTEDELDAKAVVRQVCLLPGITGCAVMFADGLRLAGNFPEGDAEGFSAMAPPFFKRTTNFAHEAALGSLQAITLYTDQCLLSFFMHQDICLSVRHMGRGFLPGVREKLEAITRALAAMYGTEKPADSTAA